MSTQTNTPRTDLAVERCGAGDIPDGYTELEALASVARSLERDNAKLVAALQDIVWLADAESDNGTVEIDSYEIRAARALLAKLQS